MSDVCFDFSLGSSVTNNDICIRNGGMSESFC